MIRLEMSDQPSRFRPDPMIAALLDRLDKRPRDGFAAFCAAARGAVDRCCRATLYPNLPLDLIEALTYGREWQLGYDKLPPLPWWVIEVAYRAFGVDAVYYLIAQITVLAAFALVWMLARRLVGPAGALVAVLIVDGLHYFNFTAAEVQSRRDPAAVLGARRPRVPRRAAHRPHARLVPARGRRRACAVGEVFRRHAGAADGALSPPRPRRAAGAAHAPAPTWRR